jgi:hypothetical protein
MYENPLKFAIIPLKVVCHTWKLQNSPSLLAPEHVTLGSRFFGENSFDGPTEIPKRYTVALGKPQNLQITVDFNVNVPLGS